MPEVIRNILVVGTLVAMAGAATHHGRWRGPWAAGLVVLTAAVGLFLGILIPSDAWLLPSHAGLEQPLLLLLGWGLFAALLPAAGRPALPRGVPPMVLAIGTGALMGELGAAAVLGAAANSRGGAARLALAAAGGALIGRVGDPALAVLADAMGPERWLLAPLGLMLAMVAWPMPGDIQTDTPRTPALDPERCPPTRWAVTGIGAGVGLAGQIPGLALPALALGCVALAVVGARRLRGHARFGSLLHTGAVAALVLLLVAAGGPGVAAMGLEDMQYTDGSLVRPILFGAAWLSSMLLDSAGAGLLSLSLLERALALRIESAPFVLGAAAAVGGLGPLAVAGAVREGWKLLLVQSVLAAIVVLLVF